MLSTAAINFLISFVDMDACDHAILCNLGIKSVLKRSRNSNRNLLSLLLHLAFLRLQLPHPPLLTFNAGIDGSGSSGSSGGD